MDFSIWVAFGLLFLSNVGHTVSADETTTESTNEAAILSDLSNSVIERSSHVHVHAQPTFKGIWKKNFVWRPRWVKTWKEKKVYVAVWKRMWGPVFVNEWIPVPKPPPGWIRHHPRPFVIKKFPH